MAKTIDRGLVKPALDPCTCGPGGHFRQCVGRVEFCGNDFPLIRNRQVIRPARHQVLMGGVVGQIEKKGLFLVTLYKRRGFVGEYFCEVAFLYAWDGCRVAQECPLVRILGILDPVQVLVTAAQKAKGVIVIY